jgi:hypothetical protein
MNFKSRCIGALLLILVVERYGGAQVYSPTVLMRDQVDTSTLPALAAGIYAQAGAVTPRQKAEAIWRFFLTDGRHVTPGFWYHIAGWAYEEPDGEMLDPLKLLNSYGFGLCYHIAPLLEAVFEAGGFEDARVWFLTGHSVTEVFYDGSYHYYDSDMMGYNTLGSADPKTLPVASVSQIAHDGNIMLGKLVSPTTVNKSKVEYPWYPADLREAAIGDLAGLFTSKDDNWLYPYTRYSQGHRMDFVLRPGEKLTRYFEPESANEFYLPYKYDGATWSEFPREIAEYAIRTEDGPRSQKDDRRWATGQLEYRPVLLSRAAYYPAWGSGFNRNLRLPDPAGGRDYLGPMEAGQPAQAVFEMQSPYVLIDAGLSLRASLGDSLQSLGAEISLDGGRSWEEMGRIKGPFEDVWHTEPAAILRSQHGRLTAVSGRYGYLVRLSMLGDGRNDSIQLRGIGITSRIQLNPRTLPALKAGRNELHYRPGAQLERRSFPVKISQLSQYARRAAAVRCVTEHGQEMLWPEDGQTAEVIFELVSPDGSPIGGFDAGSRFLDLRDGLAPDKLTAETRKTGRGSRSESPSRAVQASLAWSTSLTGKYATLWQYDPQPRWLDGKPVSQLLRWPEVDRRVKDLPAGTGKVFVRYRFGGMGMDSVRLAAIVARRPETGALEIVHQWDADGRRTEHREHIDRPDLAHDYVIDAGDARQVSNAALILSCPPQASSGGARSRSEK